MASINFRRTERLSPHTRLNVTRSGIHASVRGHGVSYSSHSGLRIRLPGGLYFRTR